MYLCVLPLNFEQDTALCRVGVWVNNIIIAVVMIIY